VILPLATLVAAAVLSWLLTGAARRYARRAELLDVPNERSLHRTPTPRGGGIAVAAVTLTGLIVAALLSWIPARVAWPLTVGGVLVAVVGWLDDRRGVSPAVRATVHAIAAGWAACWIWGELSPWAIVGVVCIMWAINLYNFMDGIDGLAGAEAVSVGIISGTLLLMAGRSDLAAVVFLVAAATSGFLVWNWPPARIFLGDVGSGFLGFTFGALSLMADRSGALPFALWMVVAGVFVFDATVTLLRRMARGERWYQAHRSHAYQRLVQTGHSHAEVTVGAVLVNLALGAICWMALSGRVGVTAAVLAGIILLTVLYLAIERRRPMFPDQEVEPR
jgi:Fuc2NAc and GlcNAc transferase